MIQTDLQQGALQVLGSLDVMPLPDALLKGSWGEVDAPSKLQTLGHPQLVQLHDAPPVPAHLFNRDRDPRWAGRSNKPHRRTSTRVPGRIGRDCVGPGRRRCRGRSLGAADKWSLRPAGGAVCSRSSSETWAAPQHSSAASPAAPPSSDCQTTYWTGTPFGINSPS